MPSNPQLLHDQSVLTELADKIKADANIVKQAAENVQQLTESSRERLKSMVGKVLELEKARDLVVQHLSGEGQSEITASVTVSEELFLSLPQRFLQNNGQALQSNDFHQAETLLRMAGEFSQDLSVLQNIELDRKMKELGEQIATSIEKHWNRCMRQFEPLDLSSLSDRPPKLLTEQLRKAAQLESRTYDNRVNTVHQKIVSHVRDLLHKLKDGFGLNAGDAEKPTESGLPPGWTSVIDRSQGYDRVFFHHPSTGQTQWNRPEAATLSNFGTSANPCESDTILKQIRESQMFVDAETFAEFYKDLEEYESEQKALWTQAMREAEVDRAARDVSKMIDRLIAARATGKYNYNLQDTLLTDILKVITEDVHMFQKSLRNHDTLTVLKNLPHFWDKWMYVVVTARKVYGSYSQKAINIDNVRNRCLTLSGDLQKSLLDEFAVDEKKTTWKVLDKLCGKAIILFECASASDSLFIRLYSERLDELCSILFQRLSSKFSHQTDSFARALEQVVGS